MLNTETQYSTERLLLRIEKKRNELIDLAENNGITSYPVLKCSMELDQLIYEIQLSEKKFLEQNL